MELGQGKLPASCFRLLLTLVLMNTSVILSGQTEQFSYFYRISFKDKGPLTVQNFLPQSLLSQRTIERRMRTGIPLLDYNDLPVCDDYLSQIRDLGLKLHCTSKWMNTALFKSADEADIGSLKDLGFIKDVITVRKPAGKSDYMNKLQLDVRTDNLPPYDNPIEMLNAYPLKNSGFNGKGIIIAVLDGGFYKADIIQGLSHLYSRKGVIETRDIVSGNDFVYDYSSHGTAVLSVLAGQINGYLEGTAPEADYILIRTEDVSSEFPAEEDYWAAGAEYADSIGADIISTSLGYFTFDIPEMNYSFDDMDGNTAFVTKAADIAASKGILVVASAGNERNKQWIRIIAPSDGDSVLCTGAVNGDGLISAFSSSGPSADGRIKPDNVAQGVSVVIQTDEGSVARANGTSFSCPVISGLSACLMQAFPTAGNTDIINALRYSGDKFQYPDSLYGYGIPNLAKAAEIIQEKLIFLPHTESVASPNPFTGNIDITFREAPGSFRLEIYSAFGTRLLTKDYIEYITRQLVLDDLQNADQGLYIIRLLTPKGTFTHKVIKVNK